MRLLKELKKDSRRSVRQLAKSLNESPATIYNRVKRLESRDVIKNWTVAVDYAKLSLSTTAFVLIEIEKINDGVSAYDVAEQISTIDGVFEVHLITGDYDLLIKVRAESVQDIGKLILNEIRQLPGVGRTITNTCFQSIILSDKVLDLE